MSETFDKYLTVAEEKQLFKTVKQFQGIEARRDYEWMLLLRQTGIRVGALAQLTVHDAQQAIFTKRLKLDAGIQKRGIEHDVPVNTKALSALKNLLKIRREQGHAECPDAPLIMSRINKGMSVRSFQARVQHWCKQAGLTVNATPHWMRHTMAQRILARSTAADPIGIVQSALGHKSRSSTGIYTKPTREAVSHAMELAS